MKSKSKMQVVDAAVSRKGTFSVVNRNGEILILYRLPQGYTLFKVTENQALSVEVNNFLADVYERGRQEVAARAGRN